MFGSVLHPSIMPGGDDGATGRPPHGRLAAWETPVMRRNSLLTILLVIAAVVLAWWLVGVLFSAVWFVVRLVVVLVVALVLYLALRSWLSNDRR